MDGSSPLARGLPLGLALPDDGARIIPARAGFTRPPGPARPGGRDHPRSRGVYTRGPLCRTSWSGSSPLARGLLAAEWRGREAARIIPARAGFTLPFVELPGGRRDHPRSRGVYPTVWVGGQCGAGSSPLARGLHEWEAERPDANRIIPARAGFTTFRMTIPPGKEDHPRSRGVYLGTPSASSRRMGSSPLARGLRRGGCSECLIGGIIPARAGFTSLTAAAVRP